MGRGPARPMADRVVPLGFPNTLTDPHDFWPVLAGQRSSGDVAVVVFGSAGEALLGYHSAKDAKALAPKVRRMHGVSSVIVIPNSGRLVRY